MNIIIPESNESTLSMMDKIMAKKMVGFKGYDRDMHPTGLTQYYNIKKYRDEAVELKKFKNNDDVE